MNNITRIVTNGICVGCGECHCEHITFQPNANGFPTPIVDTECTECGVCLQQCIYNPEND